MRNMFCSHSMGHLVCSRKHVEIPANTHPHTRTCIVTDAPFFFSPRPLNPKERSPQSIERQARLLRKHSTMCAKSTGQMKPRPLTSGKRHAQEPTKTRPREATKACKTRATTRKLRRRRMQTSLRRTSSNLSVATIEPPRLVPNALKIEAPQVSAVR